jgi:hypothetical protein
MSLCLARILGVGLLFAARRAPLLLLVLVNVSFESCIPWGGAGSLTSFTVMICGRKHNIQDDGTHCAHVCRALVPGCQ